MISPVTSQTAPTKLPSVLRSMGFESVASLTFTHRVDRLQDIISQLMKTLRLNRVRQPLPPSGLAEITIHFPGPVTQKYTVINQPIPQAPIDAAPRLSTKDTLCVRAQWTPSLTSNFEIVFPPTPGTASELSIPPSCRGIRSLRK
jgi:hypothetical protein